MELEYIGGHIYAATEPGPDGYDKTIVSVGIEPGKVPSVIDLGRPLTKEELNAVIEKVAFINSGYCDVCAEQDEARASAEDGMLNAAEIAGLM